MYDGSPTRARWIRSQYRQGRAIPVKSATSSHIPFWNGTTLGIILSESVTSAAGRTVTNIRSTIGVIFSKMASLMNSMSLVTLTIWVSTFLASSAGDRVALAYVIDWVSPRNSTKSAAFIWWWVIAKKSNGRSVDQSLFSKRNSWWVARVHPT